MGVQRGDDAVSLLVLLRRERRYLARLRLTDVDAASGAKIDADVDADVDTDIDIGMVGVHRVRKVLGPDGVALAQGDRAIHGVPQLSDVPGPGVAPQDAQGFGRQLGRLAALDLPRRCLEEHARQRLDLARPPAQRRNQQRDPVEAIVEITPKAPGARVRLDIAVGGRDHPDVDRAGGGRPEPQDLPLGEDPQQLGLGARCQLAHLVEEQGAPLGRLEDARTCPGRTGEGALLVPEELALLQGLGEGRAVDGDEGAPGSSGVRMDGPRQDLLAHPGLSQDEDVDERPCRQRGVGVQGAHAGVAHDHARRTGVAREIRHLDGGDVADDDAGRSEQQAVAHRQLRGAAANLAHVEGSTAILAGGRAPSIAHQGPVCAPEILDDQLGGADVEDGVMARDRRVVDVDHRPASADGDLALRREIEGAGGLSGEDQQLVAARRT